MHLPALEAGVTFNEYGFNSLTLSRGPVQFWATLMSYEPQLLQFALHTALTVRLSPRVVGLDSVTVTADRESGVDIVQISSHSIAIRQIEMLPVGLVHNSPSYPIRASLRHVTDLGTGSLWPVCKPEA